MKSDPPSGEDDQAPVGGAPHDEKQAIVEESKNQSKLIVMDILEEEPEKASPRKRKRTKKKGKHAKAKKRSESTNNVPATAKAFQDSGFN